jgi:hypothetical protein
MNHDWPTVVLLLGLLFGGGAISAIYEGWLHYLKARYDYDPDDPLPKEMDYER